MKKHEHGHLKKKHKCPSCEYTTMDARYLNQHKKVHSESNTYKCVKCGKTFWFYMQKKRHHWLTYEHLLVDNRFAGCNKKVRFPGINTFRVIAMLCLRFTGINSS